MRYQKKISGPLLDRIDIHIEVPRLPFDKMAEETVAEKSEKVRERVNKARAVQNDRFAGKIRSNSEMRSKDIKEYCKLDENGENLLKQAVNSYGLSARSYHKILKLARTIADLAQSENISSEHVLEALQYRPKEKTY